MKDPTAEVRTIIREITQGVARRTGRVGPEVVRAITEEVLAGLHLEQPPEPSPAARLHIEDPQLLKCIECEKDHVDARLDRVIITATGHNARGIVARVTAAIDECGGDIREISQTIVNDYFTMIIITDIGDPGASPFNEFRDKVLAACHAVGAEAMVMRDRVLSAMQRI